MISRPALDNHPDPAPARTRIWRLQFGPCWCHSSPAENASFDYVRLRRTSADLGVFQENLLIVSERVIEGSAKMYREVHSNVPDPKLVIAAGTCPTAHSFWDNLPGGWSSVEDIIPVDIRVDGCVSGNPESLLAAVLEHVFARQAPPPGSPQPDPANPTPLNAGALEPSGA